MPLNRDQFGLSEKVLNELRDALANAGYTEPFTTAAAEAEATVQTYTAAYTLTTAHAERLQRALAVFDLYSRLGTIPEAVQKACDAALAELRDIRDGKFPGLTAADGGTSAQTGAWGSRTRIKFPGETE